MENILHRKERLIITAIEIIDELGFQGLSTREIARRQEISEATLFRHFKSKNELLIAVLEYFSQFDEDIFQTTKVKVLTPKESIIYLIELYTEYYENYPAITSIYQIFEVLLREADLSEKVQEIYNHRRHQLCHLIADAQKSGTIKSDVENSILADAINGICREICLKWRLDQQGYSLKDRTLSVLILFLDKLSL